MKRAAILPICCALLAGCGGGGHHTTASTAPRATVTSVNATAQLEQAVRAAALANNHLSLYVLGHNSIPGWAPQSTGGPALAQLRSSAATRRAQGVRVQLLSANYQILSIQLDPSYLSATALIRDEGRVREYSKGSTAGRPTAFNERARVELHRVGSAGRFIVWRLVSTQ